MTAAAAHPFSTSIGCTTQLTEQRSVIWGKLVLNGEDVQQRFDQLENELEECKNHIQRLYDEIEKLLMYLPMTGSEYLNAKTSFETKAAARESYASREASER
jgi:hypothetical protein